MPKQPQAGNRIPPSAEGCLSWEALCQISRKQTGCRCVTGREGKQDRDRKGTPSRNVPPSQTRSLPAPRLCASLGSQPSCQKARAHRALHAQGRDARGFLVSEGVKAWAQPILMEGQRPLRDLQPASDGKAPSISREQLPSLGSPSTLQREQWKRWDRYRGPFAGSAQGGTASSTPGEPVPDEPMQAAGKGFPRLGGSGDPPSLPTERVRTATALLPAAQATAPQPLERLRSITTPRTHCIK